LFSCFFFGGLVFGKDLAEFGRVTTSSTIAAFLAEKSRADYFAVGTRLRANIVTGVFFL
jgi:hypothetical protein